MHFVLEPSDDWAREVLDIAKDLDPKKAKREALKLRAKGGILQNPLPGYDPRKRKFTQSLTDATRLDIRQP